MPAERLLVAKVWLIEQSLELVVRDRSQAASFSLWRRCLEKDMQEWHSHLVLLGSSFLNETSAIWMSSEENGLEVISLSLIPKAAGRNA